MDRWDAFFDGLAWDHVDRSSGDGLRFGAADDP